MLTKEEKGKRILSMQEERMSKIASRRERGEEKRKAKEKAKALQKEIEKQGGAVSKMVAEMIASDSRFGSIVDFSLQCGIGIGTARSVFNGGLYSVKTLDQVLAFLGKRISIEDVQGS